MMHGGSPSIGQEGLCKEVSPTYKPSSSMHGSLSWFAKRRTSTSLWMASWRCAMSSCHSSSNNIRTCHNELDGRDKCSAAATQAWIAAEVCEVGKRGPQRALNMKNFQPETTSHQ